MSTSLPLTLETPVTRTYTVGLRFEGHTRIERRANELQASMIIRELQQTVVEKITPGKMDCVLKLVRDQPTLTGTKGASRVAELYADRSNIGQVAYLAMLNAAKGVIDRELKLEAFLKLLSKEPFAAVEWFIFGRSPYLEKCLQYQLKVSYDYSRNLIHSARRTLDSYLPVSHHLDQPLPEITFTAFLTAIEQFYQEKKAHFEQLEKMTSRQQKFLKKLEMIHQHGKLIADRFTDWLFDSNHPNLEKKGKSSRWKTLKRFSREIEELLRITTIVTESGKNTQNDNKKIKKHSYLSVLRGILVSALLSHYNDGGTVFELMQTHMIRVEHFVAKPFRKRTNKNRKLIPLSLIMGSRYVIERPGNSTVMTELAKTKGQFQITFWRPRQKQTSIVATIRFHQKLLEFLANGACLKLLVLRSNNTPTYKVFVDLVFEGQYQMFLSKKAIEKLSLKTEFPGKPVEAIGIDINRIGEHMLVFSERVDFPSELLTITDRYLHLELVLKQLHRCLTKREEFYACNPSSYNAIRLKKIFTELNFVYARRHRLLKEIHRQCSRLVSKVLLKTRSPILCIENLHLTAGGSRGPLAKAILNMPDNVDLYERSVLLVQFLSGQVVDLRRIHPAYTSQGPHVGCSASTPGSLVRSYNSYDRVTCPACGQLVNTHHNAACLIRDRGLFSPSSSCS